MSSQLLRFLQGQYVCLPVTCTAQTLLIISLSYFPQLLLFFLFVKDLLALWTLEDGYSLESRWVDTGHTLILHIILLQIQPRSVHLKGQLGTALFLELGESQLAHSKGCIWDNSCKTGQQHDVVWLQTNARNLSFLSLTLTLFFFLQAAVTMADR